MRIPLLHADFEHGSYTKVAKALRKIWPHGELTLMQAQNTLAELLGYASLHNAQREATESFPIPHTALSMKLVTNAISWRLFLRYGMDLLSGKNLAKNLHLQELAMSGISQEALARKNAPPFVAQGSIFFYDEASYLFNYVEPWPEQTPNLLRHGMPPYKWAIYPDRRVFLWSLVVEQMDVLPEAYADDLRLAQKLDTPADAESHFITNSLVPAACISLPEALASNDSMLSFEGKGQWEVKWLVTQGGELLASCIVADDLGGIIPRLFPVHTDEVFQALGCLLCGDTIDADTHVDGAAITSPVWMVNRYRMERLVSAKGIDATHDLWDSDRMPSSLSLHQGKNGYHLSSQQHFAEGGQIYLPTITFDVTNQQRLLRDAPLFQTFELDSSLIADAGAELGMPVLGNRWHDAVTALLKERSQTVRHRMVTQAGVDTLKHAILAAVEPAKLDAYVLETIDKLLPIRYEGESEDNEDAISERAEALSIAESLGKEIIAVMPFLAAYTPLSIGYMAQAVDGEYPGSRGQYRSSAPSARNFKEQAGLLAAILVYDTTYDTDLSWTSLLCAIAPIFEIGQAAWSRETINEWYKSACAISQLLAVAKRDLDKVADWRNVANEAAAVRAQGQYLRVGAPISTTRPKSDAEILQESFRRFRKYNSATPIVVTQPID